MLAHRLPATALNMLVLCLAALLAVAFGQNSQSSQCSFTDPSGYSLSWTTNNGQVNFNLSYPNFPANSWTGVGFGNNMASGIDAILVTVSGSQVQVTGGHLRGYNPPTNLNSQVVTTQSTSYNNRNLNAQFSSSLNVGSNTRLSSGCNTWNFVTSPGGYNNGQFTKHQQAPKQKQICNIETSCRGNGNTMNTMNNNNQMNSNNPQNMNNNMNNNNQMYNPNGPYNNGPMYQPTGQQGQMSPFMGPGPVMMPGQQGQMMSGQQNYGYQPNMATPPQSQPYTGAPFVYTTTMDPTWGTSNNQQNNMQNTQNRQRDPSGQMSNMYYNSGAGSYPNQPLNSPYRQQQMQQQPDMMYNSPGQYSGYYGQQGNQPNQYQQQPMYNQNQSSSQNQAPSPYEGRKRRSIRAKRQTPGYQPTNNIYGYDYSNSLDASASTTAPIVVNPNYKYLSGPLADEYSRSYAQEVTAYDQQTAGGGRSNSNYGQNLNGNAPLLNNDQQNQQNYQQIQRDYANNPNPAAGQTYTNNIYGYNYGGSSTAAPGNYYVSSNTAYYSSTSQPLGVQRDPNQYNNNQLFYPANPYSSTASPVVGRQFDPTLQTSAGLYESGSNLKETKLRNPNQYNNFYVNGVARDYVPGTSAQVPFEYTYYDPQTSLYYPYRTSSDFQPFNSTYYDDNGVVHSSQVSGSTYTSSTISPVLYNPSTNTGINNQNSQQQQQCVQADPYWCDYYVKIFISSQTQYNYATQQMACQQLRTSLVDTYNGCCNTLRAAGC